MRTKDLGMFGIGTTKDGESYIIKLGDQQASAMEFDTFEEAENYIASKPWELIGMMAIAMATMINKKETEE